MTTKYHQHTLTLLENPKNLDILTNDYCLQKSVETVFPLNCSHPIFLDETAVINLIWYQIIILVLGTFNILSFCFLNPNLKGKSFKFGFLLDVLLRQTPEKDFFSYYQRSKIKGVFQPARSIPWMLILPL